MEWPWSRKDPELAAAAAQKSTLIDGVDHLVAALPDPILILDSSGPGFGNVGFYRTQRFGRGDALTVWKIRSLKERFRVYLDAERVVRCDHAIRFLGLPVLHLHYRIQRKG